MRGQGLARRIRARVTGARDGAAHRPAPAAPVADAQDRAEADARAAAYRLPIDPDQVFYESFSGNGMLCNPEAIFRRLLELPDQQHLRHVWALDDLDKHAGVVARFADHPRVSFVQVHSEEYVRALATSAYLVNNATLPQSFAKRDGQVYLNTWHGVPLKKMGYDLPDGATATRNVLRNLVSADYVLSANEFMTDRMYREAFRLQGVFRGTVIEEGQPRTDVQLAAQRDPGPVRAELERAGLELGDRRIILYAPTWKGETFWAPEANSEQLVDLVEQLQAAVDPDRYVVLLKAHQVIYDAVAASGRGGRILVPNDVPTNAVLGVTDLLVTDYSSIFFDYLVSGRPILHHVPDIEQYAAGRGLYLEELFGPVSQSVDDLVAHVRAATAGDWQPDERRREAVARFAPHEDGAVTDRVVDIVFRGADPARYRVRTDLGPDRPSLLVYVGGLTTNGLTTSALNLLRNLDHDRFDVSVLVPQVKSKERRRNQRRIDPRCRQFVRMGPPIASAAAVDREARRMEEGLPAQLPDDHVAFWSTEWRRVFGHARFDYGLDLSGYGTSIPYLFINGELDRRAIWLHNDLRADAEREIDGEKPLKERLGAVFTTYRHFDRLVSVSADLNRLNRAGLAEFAPADRFTFASNTVDFDRVLAKAGRRDAVPEPTDRPTGLLAAGAADPADDAGPQGARFATVDTRNVSAAVATLLEHYDPEVLLAEVRSHARGAHAAASPGAKVFIAVGRLSPEKNHARLLRAFARVWQHAPEARLVIVGSGRLDGQLKHLMRSLGLQDAVTFTGQLDNPYVAMAAADCFVMSSDHEGQPMVILEARALGLPVVSTRFGSVEDSVPPEAGLVVEQTDEALAEGMLAFLDGKVTAAPFDGDAYNAAAMRQLYAALDIDEAAGSTAGPATEGLG